MVPGCDSGDCYIRVLHFVLLIQQFETKNMLFQVIILRIIGEEKKNC